MAMDQLERPDSALEQQLEQLFAMPAAQPSPMPRWRKVEHWIPTDDAHTLHAASFDPAAAPDEPAAAAAVVEPASRAEPAGPPPLTAGFLTDLAARFATSGPCTDPVEAIDRIAGLETLIRAASGLLAAQEVAFAEQQRAQQITDGVKARDLGRGIAEQIAFARRTSPTSGARHLSYAQALQTRLPQVYAELRAGRVSETQARIAVTRTSHLSELDVAAVDAAVAPRMSGWNPGATEKAVDHVAYGLDPRGAVERKAAAEKDRRVSVRPAPDCMAIVTALLPMAQGVAVFANLRAAALTVQVTGDADGRGLGQIMADLLVTRCTGQSRADAVPMEIRVTMPAESLLADSVLPAWVDDYGPAPAALIRDTCSSAPGSDDREPDVDVATHTAENADSPSAAEDPRIWIRRLFTEPVTGTTTVVDPRRRPFPAAIARHIAIRDRTCRQPFCTAPIREIDHIVPWSRGGPTTLDNGQGLCSRGNKLKDLPGWHTHRDHGVTIVTTPTGHRYLREPQAAAGLPAITRRE